MTTSVACHRRPPLFRKATVGVILFAYFLAACFTSYGLMKRNYPNDQTTNWVMMGGLKSSEVTFRVRENANVEQLIVATDDGLKNVIFQQEIVRRSDINDTNVNVLVHSITATELEANTKYYYATTTGGSDDNSNTNNKSSSSILQRGSFRTPLGDEGTRSPFSFVASGCSWSGSTHAIYRTILEDEPDALFVAHLGDMHYEDLNVDSVERRIQAMDRVMNSDTQRALYLNKPLVYMWDDHDWLGNNKGGGLDEPGREAALESYRVAMPYYAPLPSSNNTSMYHAFTIGTIRFILSDLRTEATDTRIYSAAQRDWLFAELANSGNYDFVIWFTTKPWIAEDAAPGSSDDAWKAYPLDRQELSDWIEQKVPKNNLLAIASDAHMIAFDDGSNTYYGTNTSGSVPSFPILQTGPFDRMASFKGGPFTEGCTGYAFERNHQYSVIEFLLEDDSSSSPPDRTFCMEIRTYRIKDGSQKQELFSKRYCNPNDIFAASNPGMGTCETKHFSKTNTIMIVVSVVLLAVAMGLSCFLVVGVQPWQDAVVTSLMILVFFGATFGVSIVIPIAVGIDQYNAFEALLICALQMGTVILHLMIVAWRYCGSSTAPSVGTGREIQSSELEQVPVQPTVGTVTDEIARSS